MPCLGTRSRTNPRVAALAVIVAAAMCASAVLLVTPIPTYALDVGQPTAPQVASRGTIDKAWSGLWHLANQGLRGEVGVIVGGTSFDSNAGLGNAHFDEDVPDGGFAYGLRGSVLLGPTQVPKLAFDVEARLVHPDLRRAPASVSTAWAWRVLGRYLFDPVVRRVQPFAALGLGQEVLFADKEHVDITDFDGAFIAGGGVDVRILHRLHARLDLRWILSEPRPDAGEEGVTFGLSSSYEIQVGVSYIIGGPPPDEDGDGVYDDGRDKCLDVPEDRDNFKDDDGCPDHDNDGDGIVDGLDKCPDSPEDKDNFKDNDGCPEEDNDGDGLLDLMDKCPNDPEDPDGYKDSDGCPDNDNDGDTIVDSIDICPNRAEDRDGVSDDDGCPDLDNDGDGLIDTKDKCPNSAEDFDGHRDGDGCPDTDNDGDGIPDTKDACVDRPETFNGFEDKDGCPDTDSPQVRALLAKPIAGIIFIKDVVEPIASERGLGRLAALLTRHQALRVELRCPVGAPGGMSLIAQRTTKRCGSVVAWLKGKGIDPKRLHAVVETKARGTPKTSVLELRRF